VTPRRTGEEFIDEQGTRWMIEDVTHSAKLEGFFIVRVSFRQDSSGAKSTLVLTGREFLELRRDLKLQEVPEGAGPGK
jgi:hypothetical protein